MQHLSTEFPRSNGNWLQRFARVVERAPANSCKGVVDDYNAADIVVHCNLMRFVAELRPFRSYLTSKHLQSDLCPALFFMQRVSGIAF